jgi:hypothetical protein
VGSVNFVGDAVLIIQLLEQLPTGTDVLMTTTGTTTTCGGFYR